MRTCTLLLALTLAGCSPSTPHSTSAAAPASPPDSLARAHDLLASLELRALGNEPFWSVSIARDGIVYRDPDHADGVTFPYARPHSTDSALVFESSRTDTIVRAIRVSFRVAECSDGMSDLAYRYAAQVTLDHQQLRGCGQFRPRMTPR
jgi:uncharacterized membrane protein